MNYGNIGRPVFLTGHERSRVKKQVAVNLIPIQWWKEVLRKYQKTHD